MQVKVLNKEGKETGRFVNLSDEIFGLEPNEHVVWLDVKQYLANQRQGTHKAKERAEINRTTKKLKKQKGTGGARAGSMKSPLFVGGGRVFGPTPRDYGFKINKKTKVLARKSVLSAKAKADNIVVVEDFNFDKPSTKAYISLLQGLQLEGVKVLHVTAGVEKNTVLSSRNLPKTAVTNASDINTYAVLNAQKLILTESSVSKIEEFFADK